MVAALDFFCIIMYNKSVYAVDMKKNFKETLIKSGVQNAQSEFSPDCIKTTQAYCRTPRALPSGVCQGVFVLDDGNYASRLYVKSSDVI